VSVDDNRLTDEWEACALERAITHEEHLRIGRVLIRRHGRSEARRRLIDGTRANCEAMDVADRFDGQLTARWSERIADALDEADPDAFEEFIRLHPELAKSDLVGLPAWRLRERSGEAR